MTPSSSTPHHSLPDSVVTGTLNRMWLTWLMPGLLMAIMFLVVLPSPAADDLSGLSDEFDNSATLSEWERIFETEGWGANQLEAWDIDLTRTGNMIMMPHVTVWYREWRAAFTFKEVTGDFVVTTEVQADRRDGPGIPRSYSYTGPLVRTPRPSVTSPATWTTGGENYTFLSIGTSDGSVGRWEVKNTVNSNSEQFKANSPSRAKIQIARIGPYILTLRQGEGDSWRVHRRYLRADMPATLQVGLMAFSDWPGASAVDPFIHNQTIITNGNPDLVAAFDYIRYQRPVVPAELVGENFSSSSAVSDAELLAFLGSNANTPTVNPPRLLSPNYEPGVGFRMTFAVQSGVAYTLQSSTHFTNWTTVTNFVATSNELEFLDTAPIGVSHTFYRLTSP